MKSPKLLRNKKGKVADIDKEMEIFKKITKGASVMQVKPAKKIEQDFQNMNANDLFKLVKENNLNA